MLLGAFGGGYWGHGDIMSSYAPSRLNSTLTQTMLKEVHMGYSSALEAAGAEILEFEQFGSYQGDWWAKVKFNGQTGWVHGSFGSCSVCDAFDAEFDTDTNKCDAHRWVYLEEPKCSKCDEVQADYEKRLSDFGIQYLSGMMTQEEAEKQASANLEWDMDAGEMLKFIKDNTV